MIILAWRDKFTLYTVGHVIVAYLPDSSFHTAFYIQHDMVSRISIMLPREVHKALVKIDVLVLLYQYILLPVAWICLDASVALTERGNV